MSDNALYIPELTCPSSVVVLGYGNNCTQHFYQEHRGQLFGLFLSLSVPFLGLFQKPLPTVPFHKTSFLWWPLGLLAFLSAALWLHGDTKQAALLEQPVQPAATFPSDSLGVMSWWSSPDITSLSLGTVQTKVPLIETGTVAWITDREIPPWVAFLFNQQLPSRIRIFI